jgi:hypothetical protein
MRFAFVVTNAQLSHCNAPAAVEIVQRNVIGVVVPTHSAFVTVNTAAESVFHVALTARAAFVATEASCGSAGCGAPRGSLLAKYVAL